jgi:hypothetical protein
MAAIRDVELTLPGSSRKMRTAHVPNVLKVDPKLLSETPLVVSYTKDRVLALFDEPALQALYPSAWPAISALLGQVQPRAAHSELLALEKQGALGPEAIAVLRQAEASLLDTLVPDPSAGAAPATLALAALVALSLQHKIAELVR